MAALVFRILGRAVLTLLLLTACVFFVLHLTGDPARLMLGSDGSHCGLSSSMGVG